MINRRKICFVVTSSIHYSRSKTLLKTLSEDSRVELQIIVAASALLPQYGDIIESIKEDGFPIDAKIFMTVSGGSTLSMAKTTGIGLAEFATVYDDLKPDIVIVRGDRYEVLSAVIAASYMNILVAHLEGGDVSGNIDESVRHAVTKLSHIHFATNQKSAKRIVQMGESPDAVFDVGCTEIEYLSSHTAEITSSEINKIGVGDDINLDSSFLIVLFHPITTSSDNRENTSKLLRAVHKTNLPTIWFWPNVDAGTDDIAKSIRIFREKENTKNMHFMIYLPASKFAALLKRASCLVGNSSAGIKECSYLGVPAVNIGTRQSGRFRGKNVVDVDFNSINIKKAIEKQVKHGNYEKNNFYFKEDCSSKIVEILVNTSISPQKRFYES